MLSVRSRKNFDELPEKEANLVHGKQGAKRNRRKDSNEAVHDPKIVREMTSMSCSRCCKVAGSQHHKQLQCNWLKKKHQHVQGITLQNQKEQHEYTKTRSGTTNDTTSQTYEE